MENPFEQIIQELNGLKTIVAELKITQSNSIEIIDRPELMRRLGLTEPTIIRYEKKKVIPRIEIGSAIRYNWPAVVKALESGK